MECTWDGKREDDQAEGLGRELDTAGTHLGGIEGAAGHIDLYYPEFGAMTVRQLFYRLVVDGTIEKTEKAYKSLIGTMVMARRAKLVPMNRIRDDGTTHSAPPVKSSREEAVDSWKDTIPLDQIGRQDGQDKEIVVWCEASGMAPMLASMVKEYGISIVSSGGFDSLTAKYQMSQQLDDKLVLHLGDYDPSGVHMYTSLSEDIQAFTRGADFERIAILPEQIDEYSLPTAPVKAGNKLSFDDDRTVQCEAFTPPQLKELVQGEIESRMDMDVYQERIDEEEALHEELAELLEDLY
jgi:rhodanese-related sulfurtransferase